MDFLASFNTEQDFSNPLAKLGSAFTNPIGFATGMLKPSGFDDFAESLGIGGLLGQTSFETISSEGQQLVDEAFNIFQQNFNQNPSQALSTLSKKLHFEDVRYQLMIANASSKRTTTGLPISHKAILNGLKKYKNLVSNLKSKFTISITPKTETFHFKKTLPYTYGVYTLTPKKANASLSKDALTEYQEKSNIASGNTIVTAVLVFLGVKLFFPKLLKF